MKTKLKNPVAALVIQDEMSKKRSLLRFLCAGRGREILNIYEKKNRRRRTLARQSHTNCLKYEPN